MPLHTRENLLPVAAVVLASLLGNMVAGLVIGPLLGLLKHAYRNTQTPVRQALNGEQIGSHCVHNNAELAILGQHSRAIKALELDASQFFDSAEQICASVKSELTPGLRVTVLDWTAVHNIASSLAQVNRKLDGLASDDQKRGLAAMMEHRVPQG